MKKLYRQFSLIYVNQSFKHGLEKLNTRDINGSIQEFLSVKNEPEIQNDIPSLIKVNHYLFICLKYQSNHYQISQILQEQILLYSLQKQPENIVLKEYSNLIKSFVESNQLDKAIYYLENYRKILNTKSFSETFETQMQVLTSSINILFSNYFETKQICENLLQDTKDSITKGILYNNLALAYFFGSEKYQKENIFDNFQKGLICVEESKRIRNEDLPLIPKELQQDFQEVIKIDQDQEESEELKKYKKMKTIQEKMEIYLKNLNNILTNEQYSLDNLQKLTFQTKEALIINTNICEYLDKTQDTNKQAFYNKLNLQNFKLFNYNIHTKIFFNYYRHNIKQLKIKPAEQILTKTINIGKKEQSEYFNLSLVHYYQMLEDQERYYELDLVRQKIIEDLFQNKYNRLNQIKGSIKDMKFEEIVDHKKIKKEFLILPEYITN